MTRRLALALVVALSLLTHLKGIAAPPFDYHYHRQVNTAAIARNYAENGLHFLSPQIDWAGPYRGAAATEFPLYMWLVGALWNVFGLGAVWGRLLSAALAAAAAVYLFLFLERRRSREEAAAAALLFSLSPLVVYFGRTVQPEALALAASLAALYHWDVWLERRGALHWALAALAAFLAIAHKLPYAYCLAVLASLAVCRRGWAVFKEPLVLAAPAVCLAGVFAWYKHASTGAYVVPTHGDEFRKLFDYARLPYYLQFQLLSRMPELVATWTGVPFALLGARRLWREDGRFFHAWWALVVVYLAAGGGYTFHHEYTSLPMVPVVAAFMGCGALAAWRSRPARAAAAAALLAMPVLSAFRIKHWYGQNFAYLAGAEAAADKFSAKDDLVVANERAESVYLFALRRKGWSWDFAESGEASPRVLEKRIADGAKFYVSAPETLRPSDRAWLDARFPVAYDADGLRVWRLSGDREPVALKGQTR